MSGLESIRPEEWLPLLTGAEYGEAYFEESSSASFHFEDGRLQELGSGSDSGCGLRFLRRVADANAYETLHGSMNGLGTPAAQALARRLLGSRGRPGPPAAASPLAQARHPVYRPADQVAMEWKVGLLAEVDSAVRSEFPHIRQVSVSLVERRKAFLVINSEGECRKEERCATLFIVDVTAEKDGTLQSGHEVAGAIKGYELFSDVHPLRLARAAAARALAKLDCPPAKAGEMPVVLSSSAGGTFVHEAIGHSLEADHVQEGSSPAYKGMIGKPVAPEFLHIVDDPTLPFQRGSYAFDDEGVASRPTAVVRDGVLQDYLYDRLTALKDAKASNGHGRRESYRHRPIPRMSNLYIQPGSDDPRKIVQELDRGLLVTKMGGGQVNTATGEFVFEVDEGFWVEKGKIRHRVRDANLLGVGPQALKSIDRLGWDIGWGIGTCGKEGQGVPVSDGQPTLRIPKLLVGGRHD